MLGNKSVPDDSPGPASQNSHIAYFGRVTVDFERGELLIDGRAVELRAKTFKLLTQFARRPGALLSKDELIQAVWNDVVVTDDSLTQCVRELRAALSPVGDQVIRTVHRRGYRFEPPMAADAACGLEQHVEMPSATVDTLGPQSPKSARSLAGYLRERRAVVVGAIAVMAAVIGTFVLQLWSNDPPAVDRSVTERRSIAVLPLRWVGDGERLEFSEAIVEDLIASISKLSNTLVIARASAAAAAARDPDPRNIGKLLKVRYVLTGSVRRDGEAVHLQTQFVRTEDARVLWSERYDYPGVTSWGWQHDVALQIARTLDLKLTAATGRDDGRAERRLDVIDAVMRGHYYMRHSQMNEDVLRAREAFEVALSIDPNSVSSLAGLALSYMNQVQGRWSPDPAGQTALAEQALERALKLEPDAILAHFAMGHVRVVQGDLPAALASYERVLKANPSDAWSIARIASTQFALGKPEVVEDMMNQARRLNPLDTRQVAFGYMTAGLAQFVLGNDERALEHGRAAVVAEPKNPFGWALLASLQAQQHRNEEARTSMAQLLAVRPNWTVDLLRKTNVFKHPRVLPAYERYLEGLEAAGLPTK